jgi:Transmembrane domain of unknown function (DUF3566)
MTERSAEQAPVDSRPPGQDSHQDTARIPLAERLQRRIAAADERRSNGANGSNGQSSRQASRVLPPMPEELSEPKEQTTEKSTEKSTEPGPDQAPSQRTERTARTARTTKRPARTPKPAPEQPVPIPAEAEPTQRVVQPVSDNTVAVPVAPGRQAARRQPTAPAPTRAPRRARLRLSRIDPWSVMKVSFLLSIAFGIVTVVSVFLVWSVLGAAGVWDSINNTVSDTVSSGNNVSTFDISDYLGMSRVLGFTMLVSVIDVILITAIATLGAFLYNMAASLLGGIELTLAEDA